MHACAPLGSSAVPRVAAALPATFFSVALHAAGWAARRCGLWVTAGVGGLRDRALMALKDGARTRIAVARAMARVAMANLTGGRGIIRQMEAFATPRIGDGAESSETDVGFRRA